MEAVLSEPAGLPEEEAGLSYVLAFSGRANWPHVATARTLCSHGYSFDPYCRGSRGYSGVAAIPEARSAKGPTRAAA